MPGRNTRHRSRQQLRRAISKSSSFSGWAAARVAYFDDGTCTTRYPTTLKPYDAGVGADFTAGLADARNTTSGRDLCCRNTRHPRHWGGASDDACPIIQFQAVHPDSYPTTLPSNVSREETSQCLDIPRHGDIKRSDWGTSHERSSRGWVVSGQLWFSLASFLGEH